MLAPDFILQGFFVGFGGFIPVADHEIAFKAGFLGEKVTESHEGRFLVTPSDRVLTIENHSCAVVLPLANNDGL